MHSSHGADVNVGMNKREAWLFDRRRFREGDRTQGQKQSGGRQPYVLRNGRLNC
jgi:hypothetical protein